MPLKKLPLTEPATVTRINKVSQGGRNYFDNIWYLVEYEGEQVYVYGGEVRVSMGILANLAL